MFSTCGSDGSIGPAIQGCRDEFDFTILFETAFFSLVPSAVFIVLSCWRGVWLRRKPTIVRVRLMLFAKLVISLVFVALQVTLLILVALASQHAPDVSVAAVVLQLVAAACMTWVTYLEHGRSPRPSLLLSGYLLLTLLLDITRSRTFFLAASTGRERAFSGVFVAATATKAVYLAAESIQKSKWVQWESKEAHSPEETSGIFGLGVYAWLNTLFLQGYRKILQVEDLFPLDHAMKSQGLHDHFRRKMDYGTLRKDKYGLLKILVRVLAVPLLLPVPPRLFHLGFSFCQPFFINALLDYLSRDETETSINHGYGLIGASILIYGGIALSMAAYQYLRYRSLQMARGCLVAAIYTKLTEVQFIPGDESETLTLMSTDLERIRFGFRSMHNLWASLIEIGIASWLLYNQLGASFLAPVVVVICCTVAVSVMVKYVGSSQTAWMEWVQKRVGLTASVIGKMKGLRMSGLTAPVVDYIQQLRVDELAAGRRFRALIVLSATIGFLPLLLSPVFTFALTQRTLDSTKIFTALSYLILLGNPLSALFQDVPQFFSALACVSRIQKFLEIESREDFRDALSEYRDKKQTLRAPDQDGQPPSPRQAGSAIVLKECSFGWESENMILKDVNIDIPHGGLTIVCGPTASGKSTLCQALLAEVPFHKGEVNFSSKDSPVAYCGQEPFLFNGTIRENIIAHQPFKAQRYSEVLRATMLHVDLNPESLPDGDQTSIGSNGIILSGGQKQRVALARALYLGSNLMILDDVFSGLDNETARHVFQKSFGPNGLVRQRGSTAVLFTHAVSHLPAADHIIVLASDGRVSEQGSYDDLIRREEGYLQSLAAQLSEGGNSEIVGKPSSNTEELLQESLPHKSAPSSVLEEQKDTQRQQGDGRIYKHYVKSMGYVLTASILAWGVAIGFSQNFPNIWLTYWAADLSSPRPSHSSSYYIGIYAALNVGCVICLAGLGISVFYIAVAKAGTTLHWDVLRTMSQAPLSFFTKTDQGQVVNLFSQDMNLIDTELPGAILNGVLCLFVAIGQAAVLATTSPYLAISYPFLVGLLWVIQRFYLRTSRQLRLLDLETKTPLYTHFMDTAKGIVTLRAFGSISKYLETNIKLLDLSQRPAYLLMMVQSWLILVLDLVTMVIAAILTTLAVKLRASAGFTGASLVTLMSFGDQLTQIVIFLTMLETSLGAISRLRTFNETVVSEEQDREDIVPPEDWPKQGTLVLRNVSASYSVEQEDESDEKKSAAALRAISLEVDAGEKVAICGRTGSGKSSLISLLLKLLDPVPGSEGTILMDNVALDRIHRPTLRTRIIAIPQESVFLPDGATFQANLDPFGSAEPADCQAALDSVALWEVVQDRGGLGGAMSPDTLSAGQKQLFSLARAVVRHRVRSRISHSIGGSTPGEFKPLAGGILLLDEVSASVDHDTERMMQEIIKREFAQYTVLTVSHRLDMILDYDRLIVMDQGRIVEVGPPKLLSEQPGSRFHELLKAGGK